MTEELHDELTIDHAYLMSVERTMFEHLRFYIVMLAALVGGLTALVGYLWDSKQDTLLFVLVMMLGLVFWVIFYVGLLIYLELRVRKIKMIEQIALIRQEYGKKSQALDDNFILIKGIAACPPYLRAGCSEWYTTIFLCALCSLSLVVGFAGGYGYVLRTLVGADIREMLCWEVAALLALLWGLLFFACFRRAIIYALFYDLKRESDFNVTPSYDLLESNGVIFSLPLRLLRMFQEKVRKRNRKALMPYIQPRSQARPRPGCPFCVFVRSKNGEGPVGQTDYFVLKWDSFPVTDGHILIIPKRHVETPFELTTSEIKDLPAATTAARSLIERDQDPDGYNIGINVGKAAGQTISHMHIHVLPRHEGDVADPTGGIRNVLPGKGKY